MGITRILLREAFRKLESEDLAVRIPRRGVVVADISDEKVNDPSGEAREYLVSYECGSVTGDCPSEQNPLVISGQILDYVLDYG